MARRRGQPARRKRERKGRRAEVFPGWGDWSQARIGASGWTGGKGEGGEIVGGRGGREALLRSSAGRYRDGRAGETPSGRHITSHICCFQDRDGQFVGQRSKLKNDRCWSSIERCSNTAQQHDNTSGGRHGGPGQSGAGDGRPFLLLLKVSFGFLAGREPGRRDRAMKLTAAKVTLTD